MINHKKVHEKTIYLNLKTNSQCHTYILKHNHSKFKENAAKNERNPKAVLSFNANHKSFVYMYCLLFFFDPICYNICRVYITHFEII